MGKKLQKTHVVMLLDESSSMDGHRDAVVSSFNEYVDGLRGTKRVRLSLFKFSNQSTAITGAQVLRRVFEDRKLKAVEPLTKKAYEPNGMTPLLDATGLLINQTRARLKGKKKVLFIVHTDGQENQSKEFTQASIMKLIKDCEEELGWSFIYLGEGAAAWNAGYDFGIQNVSNFSSSVRGQSMSKLSRTTRAYAMNSTVGGAQGSSADVYGSAGEAPDDIDPNEQPKVASAIDTFGDSDSSQASD